MRAFEAFLERLASRLDPPDPPSPAGGLLPLEPAPAALWRSAPQTAAAPGGGVIHAAVALLLWPPSGSPAATADGLPEILFIKRAERDGDPWSGHIAFPGGRPEANDASLLAVALRETTEEVGIDAGRGGRILGRLPTVEPLSIRLPPIDVTAFVVLAPEGARARPQPGEVDDAFWMPLASLRDTGPSAVVTRVIRGERREWPAYPSSAGPIWGITQRILEALLALVG